jgi:hypothetical protein
LAGVVFVVEFVGAAAGAGVLAVVGAALLVLADAAGADACAGAGAGAVAVVGAASFVVADAFASVEPPLLFCQCPSLCGPGPSDANALLAVTAESERAVTIAATSVPMRTIAQLRARM